ncbi:MAG TPA: NADH-quinone oxidoreductase subunit NuoK [Chthonomonadaceae bacterium]|nr:NADH-quinone oxidoreductase subunit NuoK [Chthonomonadaceae bacterium]
MGLTHYLVVGALLFAIGAYGVLTRRNAIAVLMGVELMLNAANLNFLAFWRFLHPASMEPQVFVLIGLTVAAADAAVGLAVVLNIYRNFGVIEVERINTLKG